MMQFILTGEPEEKNIHRIISSAILFLWFMTFAMNFIAFSIYSKSNEVAKKLYYRTLLAMQAKILLIQAISGFLWFIITVYIFISTLIFERKEKYNILSGVMFLASGIAELVLSLYSLDIRSQLMDYVKKFPLLSIHELNEGLYDIMTRVQVIVFAGGIIINVSIGLAFIFLGLSVRKTVAELEKEVYDLQSVIAQQVSVESDKASMFGSYMGAMVTNRMWEGLKKMRSGASMYIASGVLDILSIFIPSFAMISFFLFIIGMMMIGSGRKMMIEARKNIQTLLHPPEKIPSAVEGDEN